MIKNIIFDIGNVLADFCWQKVIDSCGFPAEINRMFGEKIFLSDLWPEYDRGVMGDEAVTKALRARLAGYEREFDLLYTHFAELVQERDFSASLVKQLKAAGLGVYVLSNYGDTMYHANAEHFRFLPELDGAVFSYREKLLKPDPAIYRLILERFGLTAEECLFLDDSAANTAGAEKLGIHAETVDSEEGIRKALRVWGCI